MRVVTFKISVSMLERVDALARRMGKSRSEVIREALRQYLAMNDVAADHPPRAARLGELLAGW